MQHEWTTTEVWTITHCLGLGRETMVSAVCLPIFLWICDMAGLLRGTFVSWWYLPRITGMQHYYHARFPTDDWHLAYMFSLVYFSVVWKACLPFLRAYGEIPAPWSMPPHAGFPPHTKKNRSGVTQLSTWTKRGGIWTDAWVFLHYWVVIRVAG